MEKYFSASLLSVVLWASNSLAHGAVLVETGSPATSQNGAISVLGGSGSYGMTQSVALGFSLANASSISSVQGYIWSWVTPGNFTLALYSDANGLPSTELYSSQVNVPAMALDWYGVSDVNWNVSAGNYWASFEVRSGQSFYGALEFPAPIKLPAAVKNDYYTGWTNIGVGGGGGLIVLGDTIAPVPEPETYVMLLAGLGLIGGIKNYRKAKQANGW